MRFCTLRPFPGECLRPRLHRPHDVSRRVVQRTWTHVKTLMKLFGRQLRASVENLLRGPGVVR